MNQNLPPKNTKIVIVGAGGHGKVVADILRLCGADLLGFVDDNPAMTHQQVDHLPVLGASAFLLEQQPEIAAAAGIGDNKIRVRFAEKLSALRWQNAIHPTAVLADSVEVGTGIVIAARAVLNPYAHIGSYTIINTGAIVEHDCVIDDYAHVAPGAVLAGNVFVGQGTLIGVGTNIIPGRRVGEWSIVGAGSVVTQNLPANCVAVGVPARVIKELPSGWHYTV